jgi:hypothetical protein
VAKSERGVDLLSATRPGFLSTGTGKTYIAFQII